MRRSLGVVILAGGFGKRMRDVWDAPKGLIPFQDSTILGVLLRELGELKNSRGTRVVVVSNSRDAKLYREFLDGKEVRVVENGAVSVKESRGAVADLQLGLEEVGRGGVLVLPSDTVLRGSMKLGELIEFAKEKEGVTVVARQEEKEYIKGRFGNLEIGEDRRVLSFVEKPADPASEWAAAAIYYYPESEREWVKKYLEEGGNPENPGRMISYLISKGRPVYAYQVERGMVDVGRPEELEMIGVS